MEKQPRFVVEHLEKDLYSWCVLEYKHIFAFANDVLFTNITKNVKKMAGLPVSKDSISSLNLANCCILDPGAEKTLQPGENFNTFVFGGILGNSPSEGRTNSFLTSKLNFVSRNIGKDQFSTDNAVMVVKKIIEGTSLEQLQFVQGIEVVLRESESVLLPYKYLLVDGKPLLAPGIHDLLRRQKGF